MGKKTIVLIGSDHIAALEWIFLKNLTSFDYDVKLLAVQGIFLDYYNKKYLNKLIYRAGFSKIISKIQIKIRNYIIENNPSLIIVFKGMEVTPNTLKWIREKNIPVFNFNPDHPFIFSGRGSGNKNVKKSIELYDLYFSYDNAAINEIKKINTKAILLPFGFDEKAFQYNELLESQEIKRVCFVGNLDKYRAQFINRISESGIQIDVHGNNYSKFKLHHTINCYGPKYGKEFWEILQRYAIQLNLMRPHNLNSHNMRSFDIPGAGGIMLAPRTPDHVKYFTENKEVYLFDSFEEAIKKINYIFNLTFLERQIIRIDARKKALQDHTYNKRVKQMIYYFESKKDIHTSL